MLAAVSITQLHNEVPICMQQLTRRFLWFLRGARVPLLIRITTYVLDTCSCLEFSSQTITTSINISAGYFNFLTCELDTYFLLLLFFVSSSYAIINARFSLPLKRDTLEGQSVPKIVSNINLSVITIEF